jgi:hypothetical protein
MPEDFAYYSQTYRSLPEDQMRLLAGDAEFSASEEKDGGHTFTYRWPDLQITCHEVPAKELPEHLTGFGGWVRQVYRGLPDARGIQLLDRINHTRLLVSIIVEPVQDKAGRTNRLLGAMAGGLQPLIFYGNAVFDTSFQLILAPDGSFDENANVLGPIAEQIEKCRAVELDEGQHEPTAAQKERYDRIRQILKTRKVPTLEYPLFVEDDEIANLRTPAEVARRVLVLSAVTLLADGGSREEAFELIEHADLWDDVTPEERAFLEGEPTDPDLAQKLLWRLECLWVLLWALGDFDELGWPGGWCDMSRVVALVEQHENDPDFFAQAQLRPPAEILDEVQLTLLVHWAVRDAWIHKRRVPEDLNWSGQTPMVETTGCPATGVVAERQHALNWLICFDDAEWDDVDTPT